MQCVLGQLFQQGMAEAEAEAKVERDATEQRIFDGMRAAGVPGFEALAMTLAFMHALECDDYSAQYGTVMVQNLRKALSKM